MLKLRGRKTRCNISVRLMRRRKRFLGWWWWISPAYRSPRYKARLRRVLLLLSRKTQMANDSIRKLSELCISIDSGHSLLSTFSTGGVFFVSWKTQHTHHTHTHTEKTEDNIRTRRHGKTHLLRSINFGTTSARLSCLHLDLFYWLSWSRRKLKRKKKSSLQCNVS